MTSEPIDQVTEITEEVDPQSYQSWSLPHVSSDRVLSSAEKEARDRKKQRFRKNKEPRKTGPVDEEAGESIEVIDTIEETFKPLTADQLREITEAAEKEGFEAGYQKGLEIGEKEGYEKGYQTGLDSADNKVVERCERVERIIEALLIPLQSERKKLEVIMVDMIVKLTRAVVSRELTLDSSQILKLVDEAINAVPTGSDKFSLYLNAQDIALVESHLKDQSEKQFNYYTDDDLLPGGCRLETKNTIVSHTVEQRLEKVVDDFTNKRMVASDEEIADVANNLEAVEENTAMSAAEKSIDDVKDKQETESTASNHQMEVSETNTEEMTAASEAISSESAIQLEAQKTQQQESQNNQPEDDTDLTMDDDNAKL